MASQGKPNTEENAYAQLRYMQNMYSQQYQLLEEQMATYSLSLDSLRKGVQFLAAAKPSSKSKTLLNIGGGAYVEASLPEIKSILVYVGSGYLMEKSVTESKEFVEGNLKKQEEILSKLDAQRKKLQGELINISYKLESMQQQQV